LKRAGGEWSLAGWHAHVPGAGESFAAGLGAASIPDLAHRSAREHGGRIALEFTDRGESITHGQLDADSARIAARFRARIRPGDRVLLTGAASLDFVRCYLGLLRAGGVAVLANPASTAAELRHLIADSGAVLAISDSGTVLAPSDGKPPAALAETSHPSGFIAFRELVDEASGNTGPAADPEPTFPAPGPDDLALLAYTSGTTGRPKGVPLTHRHVGTSIRAAMAAWQWGPGDVLVQGLPLFHQHGLGGVHATLIAGSTARLLSRFTADGVMSAARGASVLFAVPTMYRRLVAAQEAARVLGGLRLAVCGSAPLSEALAEQVAAVFGRVPLIRYGTTESGLDVSNPLDGARGHTVGVPLPGVLVRVATPEEAEAPFGTDGEIQLRGPQVFAGYWRDPDANAAAFTADGWFRTGDIGQVEPGSGHLVIRGRSKELIITGGMNVYPREVEAALEQHPAVAEAAVAGVPHEHWGEQVTAWVVPAGDASADPAELAAHARTLLAPYKCPKQVLIVDVLPRSPTGKILRAELARPTGG
jgi:acyl-CoA synthetase (AMP-forming)/AMP-acid ligase II